MNEVVTAVVEDHSLVNWVTQSFRALMRHALNILKNHLASYRHSEAHRRENAPVAKRGRSAAVFSTTALLGEHDFLR